MSNQIKAYNINTTWVVMDSDLSATPIPVTDTVFQEPDKNFDGFAGSKLISCFSFDEDWPTSEIHPHGDEFVCLLNGDMELILNPGESETRTRLTEPGAFVLVPKGTWHTAKVHAPSTALFVTPGEGTENRVVD